jgi:polyhydroxyalkanoate synthesis regulator protein
MIKILKQFYITFYVDIKTLLVSSYLEISMSSMVFFTFRTRSSRLCLMRSKDHQMNTKRASLNSTRKC